MSLCDVLTRLCAICDEALCGDVSVHVKVTPGRVSGGVPSPSEAEAMGGGGGVTSGEAMDNDVQELLKVVPPALAQLLSFDHLR